MGQAERLKTHTEIINRIEETIELDQTSESSTRSGHNGEWWCGQTTKGLQDIYDRNLFMNEAHVHGFANRLGRTIVTIDERKPLIGIHEYKPGYDVAVQLSMREAKVLRDQGDMQPVWLLMSDAHWSALLPKPTDKEPVGIAAAAKKAMVKLAVVKPAAAAGA